VVPGRRSKVNKARRQKARDLAKQVEVLLNEIENLKDADALKDEAAEIRDAEQEAYDGLPQSQIDGERGQEMYDFVEQLDTAATKLEEVADAITEMKDALQEAITNLEAVAEGA
jgi:uncharacterized protein Yka (UPF0111/DUF47 family)